MSADVHAEMRLRTGVCADVVVIHEVVMAGVECHADGLGKFTVGGGIPVKGRAVDPHKYRGFGAIGFKRSIGKLLCHKVDIAGKVDQQLIQPLFALGTYILS